MPSLLKRGRKQDTAEAAGNGAPDPMPAAAGVEAPPAGAQAPEAPPAPAEATGPSDMAAPRPRAVESRPTYELPGTIEFDPPISYEPAPPAPPPPRSSGSLLTRALGDPGELSAEERDRQAQTEFEAAIAPVMDLMRSAVPEASTPEDAARILSENQGEITPDPQGGAYVPGDAFEADARVYYRLLRRDYEKNPRPSERKQMSHHLHGVYNKLPGTRGW